MDMLVEIVLELFELLIGHHDHIDGNLGKESRNLINSGCNVGQTLKICCPVTLEPQHVAQGCEDNVLENFHSKPRPSPASS